MPEQLTIHTDGGSRGNPGIAGVGIYVTDETDRPVYEQAAFLGVKTNNEAEYEAFLRSLKWLITYPENHSLKKVSWKLDSKLVVEQLNRNWKIKEARLAELAKQCWQLMATLPYPTQISHVPRAENKDADRLANQAMDSANQAE